MRYSVIKRWLIISCLLVLTLWLVWAAPAADEENHFVVNPTRLSALNGSKEVINTQEKMFYLQPRQAADGKSFDIFRTHSKPALARVKPTIKVRPKLEPIKPKAPNLPFTYIGKLVESNRTKVFLMKGQALHIVSQGDKIDQNYQLTRVNKQQISFLYLPLNIIQVINIEKAL